MSKWSRNRNAVELIPRNSKQICPKRNPMKNSLIILLVLTSALHADKKPKRNVSVVDTLPSTGIKTDVGGHLIIESTGIVTLTKKGQRASYHIVGANVYGGNLTEGLWTIANPFGDPPPDAGKNPFADPPADAGKNPFVNPQQMLVRIRLPPNRWRVMATNH